MLQHLQPETKNSSFLGEEFRVGVQDGAMDIGAEAIAGSGVGLDHYAGERVIAAILRRTENKGNEGRLAMAITDRRTALSGWASIKGAFNTHGGSVMHSQIERIEAKEGLVQAYFKLFGPGAMLEVLYMDYSKKLERLYQAIQMVPHAHRVEPPTPFVTPSDHDPTGAQTAAAALWMQDDAALRMLHTIDGMVRQQQISPQMGIDFVSRIMLAHRSRCGGPGMKDGIWLSPMTTDDFGYTLQHIYGAPVSQRQIAPGRWAFDFYLRPGSDPMGKAATALGVASFYALGVGYSLGGVIAGELMKKTPLTNITFEFADLPSACGYRIHTPVGPIEKNEALMASQIHQTLLGISYQVLERRAQIGWDRPPAQLFS